MASIQHLLETQFSVRMGRALTPAWLYERLDLLRRFTLPAVAAQTTDAFTWLVLCDETTDAEVLEQLREEERRLPVMRLRLTSEARTPPAVLQSEVSGDADVLITTRLDSDDAIADGYLEAVQEYASSFRRSTDRALLVNFPHGYRLDARQGRLFEDWMSNSSFHSLFERPRHALPKTLRGAAELARQGAYARHRRLSIFGADGVGTSHVRLHQHFPTHQDESMPAWLIAVHGGNLINRVGVKPRELPSGSQPAGFALKI